MSSRDFLASASSSSYSLCKLLMSSSFSSSFSRSQDRWDRLVLEADRPATALVSLASVEVASGLDMDEAVMEVLILT
ncbi:ubiquitin carboxyl-terminal hydrolase 36/42 [Sarotherodon galilaeus]